MLLMVISLDIYGENFRRVDFEGKIEDEVYIDRDLNRFQYCLSIENPSRVGVEYELEDYQEWYITFIEKYYQEIVEARATEINLMTDVFYSEQCNFEIFGREMMSRLGKYPIAFPVSVYNTTEVELEEIQSLRIKSIEAR